MQGRWSNIRSSVAEFAFGLLLAAPLITCYTLNPDSDDSVKSVASSIAQDMLSLYTGDQPGGVPGLLPQPYYWWEAGAFLGSLVDYWYYTRDTKWVNLTQEGLLFQTGPNNDYMPPNQTMTEGNDDQGFWSLAAMSAAEYNFPDPPKGSPQWLALAQAVFNTQAARWDTQECGGGLRWQIFTWNNGYDYKNSISQACFFNLGARLARYTGNQSYADWANKAWDWMEATNLLHPETYYVYDGIHTHNCSDITPYQWTYNAGAFILGASAMYNYTTGKTREVWRTRLDGLLNGTMVFFTGKKANVMSEVACEPVNLCDVDQQSFKAYLSRWMAATIKWAPWTSGRILPLLRSSAMAAVSTCKGGSNGRMCGLKWTDYGKFDGSTGIGQQMAVMEVVLANMIHSSTDPLTHADGTSPGDPGAGGQDVGRLDPFTFLDLYPPVTTADRAGACILTVVIILCMICGCVFVLADEASKKTVFQTITGFLVTFKPGHRGKMAQKHRQDQTTSAPVLEQKPFISRWSLPPSYKPVAQEKEAVIKVHHTATISPAQRMPLSQPPFSNPPPPPRRHHQHRQHQGVQTDISYYWDTNNKKENTKPTRAPRHPSSSHQMTSTDRPKASRD